MLWERWVGEVIEVNRLEFPQVNIKLRIKVPPQRGVNTRRFRKGRVLELRVLYPAKEGQIDFVDSLTHQDDRRFVQVLKKLPVNVVAIIDISRIDRQIIWHIAEN